MLEWIMKNKEWVFSGIREAEPPSFHYPAPGGVCYQTPAIQFQSPLKRNSTA